ncbi:MAG: EcsC family protein [Sciscionella sp.]
MGGSSRLAGRVLTPLARRKVPALAANLVRQAFERAVDGVGPLRGAAASADRKLARQGGDVDAAVKTLIESHVRMAGAEGFVTNLGGAALLPVTIPSSISGLALLECHLVAGIAHLRGYDLADPRVRNAVLATMLGEDTVRSLVRRKKLPSSPMAIATAPAYDENLDRRIATEVAAEMIGRIAGKRTVAVVGRRTPIIGGGVGAVADAYATYQTGRYAARELIARGRPGKDARNR